MLIKFWKPFDVLTKFSDAQGRATLADYIDVRDIYPVGRLDRDSEGLLLLTDDGGLSHRMTDPRYEHPRTYAVQVERLPSKEALTDLARGLTLNDGPTRPAVVRLYDVEPSFEPRDPPIRQRLTVPTAWISLTLTEGRNRQVRRMTAAIGHPTLRLVRVSIGEIGLDGLSPGTWMPVSGSDQPRFADRGQGVSKSPGTWSSSRPAGGGSRS